MQFVERLKIDWHVFVPALLISLAGLVTMNSFSGENYFFSRQSLWIVVALVCFFFANYIDWRFLRRTKVIVSLYAFITIVLVSLFFLAQATRGVQSWLQFGSLAFQPSDLAKLIIILILAKYFSRRHIEIRNIKHIIISGVYALIIFLLVFLQPDFGGAVVIFGIWLGMVFVSGISKRHLLAVILLGILAVSLMWFFAFAPYQKARIITFINPLTDIQGSGYNAYQSMVAVGSGEILGKGIGQGSQSKLRFLPEYETDFIFAAFVEEWGFIGAALLLVLFFYLVWRIVDSASKAETNFETFFALGLAIFFLVQILIHVGMNIGVMPVTGITLPLMSYGGSHLLIEWLSLGMLSSMMRFSRGPRITNN